MDRDEIRSVTREIVAEILELEPARLPDDAQFSELGADSVQQLEIVAALRVRFGVRYSLSEEGRLGTVDAAVAITREHLPAAT